MPQRDAGEQADADVLDDRLREWRPGRVPGESLARQAEGSWGDHWEGNDVDDDRDRN